MGVVYLHNVKLLHNFGVDFLPLSLELGYHIFTKVNCHNIVQIVESLNFSVILLNLADHVAGVPLVLEHGLDGLPPRGNIIEVSLSAPFLLLALPDSFLCLILHGNGSIHSFNVE